MSHFLKEQVVREYAQTYRLPILVESGTFGGEMVRAMLLQFKSIFSIELSPELAANNKAQFAEEDHVHIEEGDSATVMPEILEAIEEPALFWLDGHFSGNGTVRGSKDTPILEELTAICTDPHQTRCVILIDDAGCYGNPGWPGIGEISKHLRLNQQMEIKDDIIRITPCT
jgi:hypothetical protein